MKLRIIKVTPKHFIQLLQGKKSFSNLPDDLELLDIKVDMFTRQVSILVASDNFEDVPETSPIPELELITAIETKTPEPSIAVKPEVEIQPKPLIATLTPQQPSPSKWAAKMENEFSPDQRKLLSFSVKDDVVIVKPVTFLKAEWDDINDTVRSLGGKWVKGEIISYWEIPLE